ncbi:unnamed protein product [Ambrosiozyma monospora]|uniref:Unnamed protein product n=1 Tax=Ambrosiozyma monospora TaxID=43982 RepID=A0A9W6Z3I8_AMBMO|nr:unnamed protein product [Ambrosiozyma monospora]
MFQNPNARSSGLKFESAQELTFIFDTPAGTLRRDNDDFAQLWTSSVHRIHNTITKTTVITNNHIETSIKSYGSAREITTAFKTDIERLSILQKKKEKM